MKQVVVIQPSLRKQSFTYLLCKNFVYFCEKRDDISLHYIDLRERNLEFCDGRMIHEYNTHLQHDSKILKNADVIILGFPVYHYSISGVLKNYVDIMCDAFSEKQIDFLVVWLLRDCEMSYMNFFGSMQKKFGVKKVCEDTIYVREKDFLWEKLVNITEIAKIQSLVDSL